MEHVSPDAIADEQRGLVFPARVVLTGSRLRDVWPLPQNGTGFSVNPDGQGTTLMGPNVAERTSEREALATAPLSPGMAAQVEVVRRVSERSGGSIARRTGGSIARRTGRRSVLS